MRTVEGGWGRAVFIIVTLGMLLNPSSSDATSSCQGKKRQHLPAGQGRGPAANVPPPPASQSMLSPSGFRPSRRHPVIMRGRVGTHPASTLSTAARFG